MLEKSKQCLTALLRLDQFNMKLPDHILEKLVTELYENKIKKSELKRIIREEIQNTLSKAPNLKFKDIQTGQKFLRFGENGQMWEKINDKQAKFITNVGKKTAPFTKAKGTLNVFPQTMDVVPLSN